MVFRCEEKVIAGMARRSVLMLKLLRRQRELKWWWRWLAWKENDNVFGRFCLVFGVS